MHGRMKSTPLTAELYDYVVARFAKDERSLLDRMIRRATAAGMPEIMISEDQAAFLRVLLRLARPRRALDVGTLFGYSAAVLAFADEKTEVVSLESEPLHAELARKNLAEEGVGDRVEVRLGPALDSMKSMKAATFDLVLIDADKANYPAYLGEAHRLLRAGGLLLIDNAFAWGEVASRGRGSHGADVAAIRRTNDALAAHPGFAATILPLGDGLAFAVKRGA